MSAIKQRRDALLIDPSNVLCLTDRRGRPWVTDRMCMVRADLFKVPPVNNSGLFAEIVPDAVRGHSSGRRILRGIQHKDTSALSPDPTLASAVGDSRSAWFKGPRLIYVAGNVEVCRGYDRAGLLPRLHGETGLLTWWARVNGSQWSLMAVLAPRHPRPAPRADA